jgi:hypothetical protein
MRGFRYTVIFLLFLAPAFTLAAVSAVDLPNTSKWYFHADFEQMRSTEAGKHLYGWLQKEVFEEVREDAGFDLDKEADRVTAFSTANEGIVVLIEGDISQETRDKVLAMGAASGALDELKSGGKTYYHIKDDGEADDSDGNINIDLDSFDHGAYFSFALQNKIVVTSSLDEMDSLLANGGKIARVDNAGGTLFVLSAERSLVQAGVKAGDLGDDLGWDSNILGNTEEAALLIADEAGKFAIEANLVTKESDMANSLASIIRGLISLQAFNDDLDPEIVNFLQNTSVAVKDNILTLKVLLDPEVVIAAID